MTPTTAPLPVLARTWLLGLLLLLAGCAQIPIGLENPQVKVTGLELLPARGMEQRIAIHLGITNPNAMDLSIRGISYNIGIENIEVLSGVTSQVPSLKAYSETPVTVEVSANLMSVLRLVEHFSRQGIGDQVSYSFDANLDFSRWLPDLRVREEGEVRLQY